MAEKEVSEALAVIARGFSPGAQRSIMAASGKRSDGVDVPFSPTSGAERGHYDLIDDGRMSGGRRAAEPDRIDPEIGREGLAPTRLDRDGNDHAEDGANDGEDADGDAVAMAMTHLMSRTHDDEESDAGVCAGAQCEADHVAIAHEILSRVLARRASKHTARVDSRLLGLVRFASTD